MKTNILWAVTATCASLTSWTALAAAAATPDETYTGTVVSVDPNGRTLEVKEFLFSKKFDLGDHCAYVLLNKPMGAIHDLRAGEKVMVSYQDKEGVLVADRIQQQAMTETGKVEAIDPASRTLTLHSGWSDKKFQLSDSCEVMLFGNKVGSLGALQPGYYVTVTYELPQDQAVAQTIAQTGTTFTGKLTALDLGNRTLKAKSLFETKEFKLAANCAIRINGKPASQVSDLKLGEHLTFSYHDENGSDIVNRIESPPPQTESTSAQPMSMYQYP